MGSYLLSLIKVYLLAVVCFCVNIFRLKEEERKLFQQQQIHLMQKDLKLWQDELIQFQNLVRKIVKNLI